MYVSDDDLTPPPQDEPSQDGLRLHPARLEATQYVPPWGATARGKMERIRALRFEDPLLYEPDPIV